MRKHTMTITLRETYTPRGDEENYQKAIAHIIEDITWFAQTRVDRMIGNDLTVTVSVVHPEKE